MSKPSLEGRIAVVTGASAGIGLAVARILAAQGAMVVVNARRQAKLEEVVGELGKGRAIAVAGDCSEPAVIGRLLDAARSTFGREADLVVVNAGRGLNGSVLTSDTSQWEEMVRTNVIGAAHLIREAGLRLSKATEGKSGPAVLDRARDIIVLGSTVGRHVSPFSSMYGSTKFAVHGLTEGARRELGPRGVRVSLVEPGFVVSEFQGVAGYDQKWMDGVFERIGPPLTPDDVARTVAFMASQPAGVHVADVLIRPTRQDYP
ncbi:putative oxidoreductase [Phycisphaerales bacterium]|nr:putative oxidoreductase [Phycisphaerales bacterium]